MGDTCSHFRSLCEAVRRSNSESFFFLLKKVGKMFGQNLNSPYLCIRFPKGTALQDDL